MKEIKTAEEFLSDEIDLFSKGRLFAVVDDLIMLIGLGKLKQVAGEMTIDEVKTLPSLDGIALEFETIPNGTHYALYYNGGGVFQRGQLSEFIRRPLKSD